MVSKVDFSLCIAHQFPLQKRHDLNINMCYTILRIQCTINLK